MSKCQHNTIRINGHAAKCGFCHGDFSGVVLPKVEAGQLRVVLTSASKYRAESATIEAGLAGGRSAKVEVWGPEVAFGQQQEARINWSAIGSVGAADAATYAKAIQAAVDLAPFLKAELAELVGEQCLHCGEVHAVDVCC